MTKSQAAFEKVRYYSQEQVDKICQAMALAAEEHHMDLAVDALTKTESWGLLKIRLSRTSTQVNTFGTTSVTIRLLVLSKTMMKTKLSKLLIHLVSLPELFLLLTQPTTIFKSIISARHGIQSSSHSTVKQ